MNLKSIQWTVIIHLISACHQPDVMSGTVPKCPTCTGVVKPDIVFFGEELPRHFFKYLTDFPLADLLIVMGTSLEVSASDFIMSLKHETMCEDLIFKVNVFGFILICIYSQKVVLYNVDI